MDHGSSASLRPSLSDPTGSELVQSGPLLQLPPCPSANNKPRPLSLPAAARSRAVELQFIRNPWNVASTAWSTGSPLGCSLVFRGQQGGEERILGGVRLVVPCLCILVSLPVTTRHCRASESGADSTPSGSCAASRACSQVLGSGGLCAESRGGAPSLQ